MSQQEGRRLTMIATMPKRIAAVAVSAMLALSIGPAPALASTLSAGDTVKPPAVQTQATARKTAYVVTKVKRSTGEDSSTISFSYGKSGLVKKSVGTTGESIAFTYDGKGNLTRARGVDAGNKKNYTATYKGGVISSAEYIPYTSIDHYYAMSFKKKSGRAASYTSTDHRPNLDPYRVVTAKVSYDKAGRVSRHVFTDFFGEKVELSFSYDKRGNVKKLVSRSGVNTFTTTVKNAYDKKGRLAKQVVTSPSAPTTTYAYSYKAVKVSAAMDKKAEAQKRAIQNCDMSSAIRGVGYGAIWFDELTKPVFYHGGNG